MADGGHLAMSAQLPIIQKKSFSCELNPPALRFATPQSCESMSNTGNAMQPRMRWAMSFRYVMLVLSLLLVTDAHIPTALGGHKAMVAPTCGARLLTLKRRANPSVLQSVEPGPAPASQSLSPLLHGPVLAASPLGPALFPHESWPQDLLHAFLHIFLC